MEEEEEEEDDGHTVDLALLPSEHAVRRQQIRNKILAVGKMQRVFQLLRCVSDTIWSCTVVVPPRFHDLGCRVNGSRDQCISSGLASIGSAIDASS